MRLQSISRRVKIKALTDPVSLEVRPACPSVYVSVSFDAAGALVEVDISEPGKFGNRAMGDLMTGIARALNETIAEVRDYAASLEKIRDGS